MERIDRKFQFTAYKTKDVRSSVTENDAIIFKCADNAVPEMLERYEDICRKLGADGRQLQGILLLRNRVDRWRTANPDLCKVADVSDGVEVHCVCAPNELGEKDHVKN